MPFLHFVIATAGCVLVTVPLQLGIGIQSGQAGVFKTGSYYPDHGLERIVDYHERQDTRFAEAAAELSERFGKPILTATELAVADPSNAGPAAVRASGRLCYPSGERAVDFAPGDHRHHRGVFLAWHATEGQKPADFWGWGKFTPTDGRVIALASGGAKPLEEATGPQQVIWGQPEDPGYLLPEKISNQLCMTADLPRSSPPPGWMRRTSSRLSDCPKPCSPARSRSRWIPLRVIAARLIAALT